jgi:hypothetical protein
MSTTHLKITSIAFVAAITKYRVVALTETRDAMRSFHFDPFGEPLQNALPIGAGPGRASKIALRLGVGLFWGLVVGILAARVMYFNPDFAQTFGAVAANSIRGLFHI